MGQITHPTLGSPCAMVTPEAELVTTGSQTIKNFINQSGELFALTTTSDNKQIRICSQSYLQTIAEGNIPGHYPFSKIGYNADIDTAEEDMWTSGITYTWSISGIQMVVYSTSALDYHSGAGIQQVRIKYLTSSYIEDTETITLSGTRGQLTSGTDIFRINSFKALTCGSAGVAKGNVQIGTSGTAAGMLNYSIIGSGFSRSRNVIYTVPSGQTLYINQYSISSVKSTPAWCRFTTKANIDTDGTRLNYFMPYNEVCLENNAFEQILEVPAKLPEKTDLKVSAIAESNNVLGTCSLRGWLEF